MHCDLDPLDFIALEAHHAESARIARVLAPRNPEPAEVRDSMRGAGRALCAYLIVVAVVIGLARVVALNLPGV